MFLFFLRREKGQTERTIKTNRKLITKLQKECGVLDVKSVRSFINKCLDKKLSPSYIKQHVSIVRQWGECFKIPELQEYPYPQIHHSTDFVRGIFSDDEIVAFLSLPNPHTPGVYADRYDMWMLFYKILFFHGMRTIEVAQLTVDMVDFGRNAFVVPPSKSKTHTERLIPLSPEVKDELRQYIARLSQENLFPPLHKSTKAPHVGQCDWNLFFKKQLDRLGIKRKNLNPYSTRHSYGTRQVDEDVNLFKIKEIMGHKRIETTMKYLQTSLKSLQKIQDNDRLRRQAGAALLKNLIAFCYEYESKFGDKLLVNIDKSLDGKHAVIDITVLGT